MTFGINGLNATSFLKGMKTRLAGRILRLPEVAVFLLILCLQPPSAAGSGPAQSEGPGRPHQFRSEVSTLNIGFDTSSDELASVLTRVIDSRIYRGSAGTGGLTVDIRRNGPFAVAAADDFIYLTMPVTISLQYGGFKDLSTSAQLRFRMTVRFTPDWKLHAEIYYLGISDLFAGSAGLGPFSIKPRSIIEGITDPLQKVMSDLISRRLNEKYSLRSKVEQAWNASRQPVLLDGNYSAWLKITPVEVVLYPLYAYNNRIKLSLGLNSLADMVIGPRPPSTEPAPLPELKFAKAGDRGFRVALNTDLFYRDILRIADPLLLNKELGTDGRSIILKDLDIYGKDDRLIVKADAVGSYEGVFYLTCRPSFDARTGIFSVEDVDFDMSTRNVLLKTAGWLLHSRIRTIIAEKISMNLSQRLEQTRRAAQESLHDVKLSDHIFLKGRVDSVRLHDVMVQADKICIQLYTEGDAALFLR